ncbi:uncharacterized protein BcabD6B2_48160 [Babesia caballi]|uniref:Uncharacterized protein n=1 Tax=Babesia caballi TaxID=5871 RepID=A0AAV4M1X3_BABCB|nr:hypothetical protein, conserved [Babesia caballi]
MSTTLPSRLAGVKPLVPSALSWSHTYRLAAYHAHHERVALMDFPPAFPAGTARRRHSMISMSIQQPTASRPSTEANPPAVTLDPHNVITTRYVALHRFPNGTCSGLTETLASTVAEVAQKGKIHGRPVFLTVLSQPSTAFVHLLSTAFRQRDVAVALLPLDFSLLRSRLPNDPPASFQKHVVDNWRSLVVEARSDVVLTTCEYYPLLAPVCRDLAIPIYVLAGAPTILSAAEFESAMRAGHGYFDLINTARPESAPGFKHPNHEQPLLADPASPRLHVFSEIGSCNGKVAIHTAATLKADLDRVNHLFRLVPTDEVLNCLFPHEYSSTVYGVVQAFTAGARVLCPLTLAPASGYTSLKPQFPLTAPRRLHETVALSLAQSVFVSVRSRQYRPTVLLCSADTFKLLLDFITCDELSSTERRAYLASWGSMERIFVFEDASKLSADPLRDVTAAFLKATSLTASVTQVYTLPEVGAVAHIDLSRPGSHLIALPGCNIIDGDTQFTVRARTGSVFQAYLGRPRATQESLNSGELCLTFRKPVDATPLLAHHSCYVTYFKRRRERMARYPQGYIKQVPVRTQFWGNFTGRHRHHSVL